MAYISKIEINGSAYSLKDEEVRTAVETLQTAVASSLVFKGVVSNASQITGLTDYLLGWTYKASANFSIDGLGMVENGDMIVCILAGNSYAPANWTIIQNNVDIMSGATDSTAGTRGLVPAPKIEEKGKYLKGDGTWSEAELFWGSF